MLRSRWVLTLGLAVIIGACTTPSADAPDPAWETIFDGQTLDGWTPKIVGQDLGSDRAQIFRVEDGALTVSYDNSSEFGGAFGHIFFAEALSDYRLKFDYQFRGQQAEGGPGWAFMNSGVMVHAQAPASMGVEQAFPISVEAQLLGRSDDTPGRTTANICTPGTQIVIDGTLVTQHCIDSSTLAAPADQWVTFEIEVRGSEMMRLQIAGQDAFTLSAPEFDTDDGDVARLGLSGAVANGYFALQAESHPVAFRNIQLMRLGPAVD